MYEAIRKEFMASASLRKNLKPAPRMFVAVLMALDSLVVVLSALLYLRVFAWWVLFASWASLRFSDRRGIFPSTVKHNTDSLTSILTRSKTLGTEKGVSVTATGVRRSSFSDLQNAVADKVDCYSSWLMMKKELLDALASWIPRSSRHTRSRTGFWIH